MDNLLFAAVAFVLGLAIGYLANRSRSGSAEAAGPVTEAVPNWWEIRETLTGTQLQILQHMEECRAATIAQLQEKFSFIPDRELYYRLEQICLMGFMQRVREDGEMHYSLNPAYSGTVEEDKTVILT